MSAVQIWKTMVEAEHGQTDRVRDPTLPSPDHWQPLAEHFRADPYHPQDPLVERLREEIGPDHTLIDVGAGAGRVALPLALRCRHVTAVEPSPSMASILLEQADLYHITNVSLVQARWEEAQVEPADFVICVHVLYTISDIEAFVRKLEAHARQRLWIILHQEPPQRHMYPLWKRIHGEERLWLPSLLQFSEILRELGINAQQEALPPLEPKGFRSLDDAQEQLRARLFLTAGSLKDKLLHQLLPQELEKVEGGFQLHGTSPHQPVLVSWRPAS